MTAHARTLLPTRRERLRCQIDLIGDLVGREFKLRYRRSMLGWLWAWAQPLARLAVMGFLFSRIIPVGREGYAAFLFTGLLGWALFSAGVASVTDSLLTRRELLMRPGLPRVTLPAISICTDAVDYLIALPILLALVGFTTGLPITALWLPLVIVLQILLALGLGLLLSVANVYVRDIKLLVDLALLMGFYATPVFYDPAVVPTRFAWMITWNPVAQLLGMQRDMLLSGTLPAASTLIVVGGACVGTFIVGLLMFSRTTHSVVDEL